MPVSLAEPAGSPVTLPPLQDTALIGAGAIGTAITLTLRELGAEGALTVVDPEWYEKPNVTTYSLGDVRDAARRTRKVKLIRRELPGVDVRPLKGTARELMREIDAGRMPMPNIVLGAVDSVDARREIAAIHALHTLDGSTGGSAGTTLSLAEATATGPCLRCYYPPRTSNRPTVEQLIAERTGFSLERIARGQDPLTAAEVAALPDLPPETRAILEAQIDKPICGLGRPLGLIGNDDEFNPSAAFVAQQAAALVVGALIRGGTSTPANFVQYDALFGPRPDMTLPRVPDLRCRCQRDSDVIGHVRTYRMSQRS